MLAERILPPSHAYAYFPVATKKVPEPYIVSVLRQLFCTDMLQRATQFTHVLFELCLQRFSERPLTNVDTDKLVCHCHLQKKNRDLERYS